MESLTPEYMRAWEARLTPAQKARAFALAEEVGWDRTMEPPIWVWAECYRLAELDCPSKGNPI